jgi:hypothetical protein
MSGIVGSVSKNSFSFGESGPSNIVFFKNKIKNIQI